MKECMKENAKVFLIKLFSISAKLIIIIVLVKFFKDYKAHYEVPHIYMENSQDYNVAWDYYMDEFNIHMKNDKEFKVLQLTDLHIGGSVFTKKADKLAFDSMTKVIKTAEPDLIVVTGDLVYTSLRKTHSYNNRTPFIMLCEYFENLSIPWTFTFGNHDTESRTLYNFDEIINIAHNYEMCLFQKYEPLGGRNNLFINIFNSDNTYRYGLVLLDSGDYEDGQYAAISEEQLDWYEHRIKSLSTENNTAVKTMMFFHIPPYEFQELNKFPEKPYIKRIDGMIGEKNNAICNSYRKNTLFERIERLNSTTAIFVGHDHLNDLSFLYKNIRCTYGKSIDYLAYDGIEKSNFQRGGTLISIDKLSNYSILPITVSHLSSILS